MHMKSFATCTILCLLLGSTPVLRAQKDTTKKGVDIISSFKPVLREAAKIQFSASPPPVDSTRPRLNYDIPNQTLLFPYQPGTLKPLALSIDSGGRFINDNYIKAGFGSLRTPFVQAGFSFGDGKTAGLNIYARHVASEGKREYQDFSQTMFKLAGYYKTGRHQWDASLGMQQDRTYKYGYEPASLSFTPDSLRQRFQTISARLAMKNSQLTEFGLLYQPELKVDIFSDQRGNNESNTSLSLPLEKAIGESFAVRLGLNVDLTRLSPDNKAAFSNNMYYLSPSVSYRGATINAQVGIRPSWDNGDFRMFPNIQADISSSDQRFTFQAGWTGYLRKTSYQYLAGQNPWLFVPDQLLNTQVEERYAGFKGTVGEHFSYAAKVGFNQLRNQPLFVNDTVTGKGGKSFRVVNESRMNVVNFGGELGFTIQEKLSVISALQFNQFSGFRDQAKAWGLLPLEWRTSLRLQVIRDLWLTSDLFAWGGPKYRRADGSPGDLGGAADLNAGLEFRITRNLNLWTQFNNIFNKQYQRWNQYPVYGFNFVGGLVFSFAQKN